jgi:hypothetical protein
MLAHQADALPVLITPAEEQYTGRNSGNRHSDVVPQVLLRARQSIPEDPFSGTRGSGNRYSYADRLEK